LDPIQRHEVRKPTIDADRDSMSGSADRPCTSHRLAAEQAAALAWMLEVAARHLWEMGDWGSATALEGGAVSLRLAGVHDDEFEIVFGEGAVDDLTSIAWDVLDQLAGEPDLVTCTAEFEWSQIGADLMTRDQTGDAFRRFVTECPRPEDLPAYAAGLVSMLRHAEHLEIVVEA
jgi:hypothetical protein